jgi:hypothetical protein
MCCVFGNGVRKIVSDSEVLELVEKNLEDSSSDMGGISSLGRRKNSRDRGYQI